MAYLQQWSNLVTWSDLRHVEQDLIICRALCDLFNSSELAGKIAFRGGTAINKLLFKQPLRYSEDIDLVQICPEPIGPAIDAIREALAWLGRCNVSRASHSTHLICKFSPEIELATQLKLKVEINTREHHSFLAIKKYPFEVDSDWYKARTDIASFEPEELFGTKFRALLQRRKNRDLFDLYYGLRQLSMNTGLLLRCFEHYLDLEENSISRARAEQRMLDKLNRSLTEDIEPFLPLGVSFTEKEALDAFEYIWSNLIVRQTALLDRFLNRRF
jgi:predicted nucleotidyltransferase component of viral defense system